YVRATLVCSYFSLEYHVEHRSLSPDRQEEMKQKFGSLELHRRLAVHMSLCSIQIKRTAPVLGGSFERRGLTAILLLFWVRSVLWYCLCVFTRRRSCLFLRWFPSRCP